MLVVANNNREDVSWIPSIDGSWMTWTNSIYQPLGRESHSYLTWIIDNYEKIERMDEVAFVQGDPFKHDPDFLEHLSNPFVRYYGKVERCDSIARPHYDAPLNSWCNVLGLPPQESFPFVAGAQFRVNGAQIKGRPLELYKVMLDLTFLDRKAPWIFERLYGLVFGLLIYDGA